MLGEDVAVQIMTNKRPQNERRLRGVERFVKIEWQLSEVRAAVE